MIGTLAQAMIGMRVRMDKVDENIRIVELSIDEHTHRPDRIEKGLGLIDAE